MLNMTFNSFAVEIPWKTITITILNYHDWAHCFSLPKRPLYTGPNKVNIQASIKQISCKVWNRFHHITVELQTAKFCKLAMSNAATLKLKIAQTKQEQNWCHYILQKEDLSWFLEEKWQFLHLKCLVSTSKQVQSVIWDINNAHKIQLMFKIL